MAAPFLKTIAKPVSTFLKGIPKPIAGAGLSPVKHTAKAVKSPIIDKVVNFLGGNNQRIMGRIEADAIRGNTFGNLKSSAKQMMRMGFIDKNQAKARIAGGRKILLGEGNMISRAGRNAISDISHPIDNLRGSMVKMLRDYNPATKTWSNKSLGGMTGSAIMNIGLPASFIAPIWKDKEMSTGKKIGKSVGYAAAPLMFTRFLPSMAAYGAIDKAFPASKIPGAVQ